MRKTLRAVVAVVYVSLLFSMTAYADGTSSYEPVRPGIAGSPEQEELEAIFQDKIENVQEMVSDTFGVMENDMRKYEGLEFAADMAYKLYSDSNWLYTKAQANNKTFSSLISDKYRWVVPIKNYKGDVVAKAGLYKHEDGKWGLESYGPTHEHSDKEIEIFGDYDNLTAFLTEVGMFEDDVADIKIVTSYSYGSSFFSVKITDGNEYVIPVAVWDLMEDVISLPAYPSNRFIDTLADYERENPVDGDENSGGAGGLVYDNSNSSLSDDAEVGGLSGGEEDGGEGSGSNFGGYVFSATLGATIVFGVFAVKGKGRKV